MLFDGFIKIPSSVTVFGVIQSTYHQYGGLHEHGNVVCIERGSKLTYDIHYQIRLVEASSYDIDSYATLKGFVSGLYAGNYDITHIFIDSLCKIVPGPCDNETEKFLDWLNAFGEKHGIKFTITISDDASLAPEGIKKYF